MVLWGPLAVSPSQHRIVPSSLFLLFCDHITLLCVLYGTQQNHAVAGVKESSGMVMVTPSDSLLLPPPPPLAPPVPLPLLPLCDGVPGVRSRERVSRCCWQ